jgi:hypothetical protein
LTIQSFTFRINLTIELIQRLRRVEIWANDLFKQLTQRGQLIADGHRIANNLRLPKVNVTIFWWLSADVKFSFRTSHFLNLLHICPLSRGAYRGASKKSSKLGTGSSHNINFATVHFCYTFPSESGLLDRSSPHHGLMSVMSSVLFDKLSPIFVLIGASHCINEMLTKLWQCKIVQSGLIRLASSFTLND